MPLYSAAHAPLKVKKNARLPERLQIAEQRAPAAPIRRYLRRQAIKWPKDRTLHRRAQFTADFKSTSADHVHDGLRKDEIVIGKRDA